MKNNEFKKTKAILVENIIRLENFFNKKKESEIFTEFCLEKVSVLKNDAINSKTLNEFKNIAEEFIKVEEYLSHFKNDEISYSALIFLEETLKKYGFINYYENAEFIPAQSFFSSSKCSFKNKKTFIPISTFCNNNSVFWPYMVKQIAISFEPIELKAEDFSLCEGFAELFKDIYSDIIAVKMCGPSYYIAFIHFKTIKALTVNDSEDIKKLFIRHLFLYKNIKLVDSVKALSLYYEEFNKLLKSVANKQIVEDFEKIEKCSESLIENVGTKISERLKPFTSYSSKDLKEAHKAINKFAELSFACADAENTISEIRKEYNEGLNLNQSDIYLHLNKLKEIPFSPVNIINAECLYLNENIEKMIEKCVEFNNYEFLNHFIGTLNDLAVKSIEINKIHRILINEG